jgi:hypothetical protein
MGTSYCGRPSIRSDAYFPLRPQKSIARAALPKRTTITTAAQSILGQHNWGRRKFRRAFDAVSSYEDLELPCGCCCISRFFK